MTKEVDFPKSSYLSDLAILPVINFIDTYHSYCSGKAAPQMIAQCMLQEVKTVLISSSVAKTWGLRIVHELDAWKSTDVITLIQEYVTPNSKQDFYNKLKACTEFPAFSSKYDVELSNFHFFSEKYTVYVTRFRFAYLFLSEYVKKVDMLPFDRSPDDKHMNLRALFLNRLPFGIANDS